MFLSFKKILLVSILNDGFSVDICVHTFAHIYCLITLFPSRFPVLFLPFLLNTHFYSSGVHVCVT